MSAWARATRALRNTLVGMSRRRGTLGAGMGARANRARPGDGTTEEIVTVGLPKFIVGHPIYGAIPADPETNPTWEL